VDYTLFGHLTYSLIALSFLVRDILWLRVVAVVASLSGITYSYVVPAQPLWLVVNWNIVFVAINSFRIAILLKERMGIDFSPEERHVHETVFADFSSVEFSKLMQLAQWTDTETETLLVREGQPVRYLTLIYQGTAVVEVGGRVVADLDGGHFVGEMSFITNAPASATVTCGASSRLVQWPREALDNLLKRNPGMRPGFQGALGRNMAAKLVDKGAAEDG
jgi:hypothetical protein